MNVRKSTFPEVAVLGAAALDWVAQVDELPQVDGIVFANRYTPMPGGTGGNVAEAVARLGHNVRFLGVLGDDEGGRVLLRAFEEAGVDVSGTRIGKGERSASTFIAVDAQGERLIFGLGGAALYDKAGDVDPAWLRGAKLLFIADAFQEVALAAMQALDPGALVVFNPGGLMVSAGREFLDPILARMDVLIVSRREAEQMTGEDRAEAALHVLAGRGPKVVMLTSGKQGVWLLDHGAMDHVLAFEVAEVVDTTGAGDAFSGGVIAGFLEGLSWVEAAKLGCAVAAIKITHRGGRGGLPDNRQVKTMLQER